MVQKTDDKSWILGELIQAVRLLAAPYKDQIAALPDWVAVPDEIALLFDDAFSVLDPSRVPDLSLRLLREIDSELAAMSDDTTSEVWTTSGLEQSETWERLRGKAYALLEAMGERYQTPMIARDSYVRSRLPSS